MTTTGSRLMAALNHLHRTLARVSRTCNPPQDSYGKQAWPVWNSMICQISPGYRSDGNGKDEGDHWEFAYLAPSPDEHNYLKHDQ